MYKFQDRVLSKEMPISLLSKYRRVLFSGSVSNDPRITWHNQNANERHRKPWVICENVTVHHPRLLADALLARYHLHDTVTAALRFTALNHWIAFSCPYRKRTFQI